MTLTAIGFKPWHFDAMDMRQFERERVSKEQVLEISERGQIDTLIDENDMIIAVFGFYHLFPSVIEVYMIPSIHISKCAIPFIFTMRKYLKALETLPVHRIQTLALASAEDDRWMSALGFRFEGTLAKYTDDGLDFRMWARVKQ